MMKSMKLPEVFVANARRFMAAKIPPWNQAKLAAALGIKPPTVTQMLGGSVWPSDDRIEAVAKVLEVRPIDLTSPGPVSLPLYGKVGAGKGSFDPGEVGERVYVTELLKGSDAFYQVAGDSMRDAGMRDGDLVFVRKDPAPSDKEIVVAWIGERGVMVLKQIEIQTARTLLNPRDDEGDHEPIYVGERDSVLGAYVGLIRSKHAPKPGRGRKRK